MNIHIVISLLFGLCLPTSSVIVQTRSGFVEGITQKNQNGENFYSFRGIPYAQPPLGELRFKAPVPKVPWNGVFNATSDGNWCMRSYNRMSTDRDSEDCLILNVYSKDLNQNLPVIVHLVGGFYLVGNSDSSIRLGPHYLLNQDIVLVTFNYRNNIFGLANSDSSDAPGNAAFKDMVLALKWVQENIDVFGGNPNLVTLMGGQSGASAATAMMVSPMAKGLFHRAIVMSGSSTAMHYRDNIYWTNRMAKAVKCPVSNSAAMMKCLRSVPFERFGEVYDDWSDDWTLKFTFDFEIEKDYGQERFLIEHPTCTFSRGDFVKVPILTGITRNELDFLGCWVTNNVNYSRPLDEILRDFSNVKQFLHYPENHPDLQMIGQQLQSLYIGNKKVSSKNCLEFGRVFSDNIVGHPIHRFVSLTQYHTDVYYYFFNHFNQTSATANDNCPNCEIVSFGDEFLYLYSANNDVQRRGQADDFMIQKMINVWVNFAKIGKPDVEWSPTSSLQTQILSIGSPDRILRREPYEERYKVWDELFPVHEFCN